MHFIQINITYTLILILYYIIIYIIIFNFFLFFLFSLFFILSHRIIVSISVLLYKLCIICFSISHKENARIINNK